MTNKHLINVNLLVHQGLIVIQETKREFSVPHILCLFI